MNDEGSGSARDRRSGPRPAGPRRAAPGDPSQAPAPGRAYRTFLTAAVLLMLGLLATAGVKSYSDLSLARAEERRLLGEIADARERIRAVTERIDRIENDPAMLERLAREELGLVREGDVVIVLPEEDPQASSSRAATTASKSP